jgi:hypothetical protein
MNVTGISNLNDTYIQSILSSLSSSSSTSNSKGSGVAASSLTLPQDGNAQLSPFAEVMSALQQLQQSNPTQYQQVTSQIATNLQSAAKTATTDGNTTLATQLNQLATDFTNASQNNTLPNVQDLAQAMGGGHGHHHHMSSGSSTAGSSSSTDSTTSSTTGASSSTTELNQLLAAFMTNSGSSSQSSSLDPFSIIANTLSSAGISLGQ